MPELAEAYPGLVAAAREGSRDFRDKLREYHPRELRYLLFGSELAHARPVELSEFLLANNILTLGQLLLWVFRQGRVAQFVLNTRRVSEIKPLLLGHLRRDLRRRYPSLTDRVIHAMAFRPEWFTRPGLMSAASSSAGTSGLYRRVVIPKSSGRGRVLWVPSPPLKRVQGVILRRVLQTELHRLGSSPIASHVFGAGLRPPASKSESGPLANARAHVGQRWVACFDIAEFYASVPFSEVYRVFRGVDLELSEEQLGRRIVVDSSCALLLAKLVTRHGRLPQGPPTSPAIANLVFTKWDASILRTIGDDVLYTRYFDDLTLSVSPECARRHGISSARDLQDRAYQWLATALRGSPFRLNPSKTRSGDLTAGLEVTGYRVMLDAVTLPRAVKRYHRLLAHMVTRRGITEAGQWRGAEDRFATRFAPERRQHFRSGRRLSNERLAIRLLQSISKDIKVSSPPLGGRLGDLQVDFTGATAWRYSGRLLTAIWQGLYVPEFMPAERQLVFRDSSGRTAWLVSANQRILGFFMLSLANAGRTIEMWLELAGRHAWVSAADERDPACGDLSRERKLLASGLDSIDFSKYLVTPGPPPEPNLSASARRRRPSSVPVSDEDDALHAVDGLLSAIAKFASLTGAGAPRATAPTEAQYAAVRAYPVEQAALRDWLDRLSEMLHALSHTPSSEHAPKSVRGACETAQLLADAMSARRSRDYKELKLFLARSSMTMESPPSTVQRNLVFDLQRLFSAAIDDASRSLHPEWLRHQQPAKPALHAQLKAESDLFLGRLGPLRSTSEQELIFQSISWPKGLDHLGQEVRSGDECWGEVYSCAHVLVICTFDALEGAALEGESRAERDRRVWSSFRSRLSSHAKHTLHVLVELRNRAAHPTTKERHREVAAAQIQAVELLGRQPAGVVQAEFESLPLTALEATCLKLELLKRMNSLLGELAIPLN